MIWPRLNFIFGSLSLSFRRLLRLSDRRIANYKGNKYKKSLPCENNYYIRKSKSSKRYLQCRLSST